MAKAKPREPVSRASPWGCLMALPAVAAGTQMAPWCGLPPRCRLAHLQAFLEPGFELTAALHESTAAWQSQNAVASLQPLLCLDCHSSRPCLFIESYRHKARIGRDLEEPLPRAGCHPHQAAQDPIQLVLKHLQGWGHTLKMWGMNLAPWNIPAFQSMPWLSFSACVSVDPFSHVLQGSRDYFYSEEEREAQPMCSQQKMQ